MKRIVKIASGWLAADVDHLGDEMVIVSLRAYDQDGRCVRDDWYDEPEMRSGAPALARRLEEYGATPDEARSWADEFLREARAERESFDEQWSNGGRHIVGTLETLGLCLATIGVWLVGVGFLVWLIVTRVF